MQCKMLHLPQNHTLSTPLVRDVSHCETVERKTAKMAYAKMARDMSKWQTVNMAGGFSFHAKMAGGGRRSRGGLDTITPFF